ncbi:anticodon-binding protein [Pavlovales sp. CCMP2436]|nr:anticodon-binding protein [Pavlovales sp. CCMP2436]
MEYADEELRIKPSVGVDRCFLAVLCSVNGEARTLLRFHPRVAPIKAAVFPLVKNNPQLIDKATELYKKMQRRHNVAFDAAGNIGRRYRRMDKAGTPFCITVDFDTLDEASLRSPGSNTVTLRDRDSTEQRRISVDDVVGFVTDACE